MAKSHYKGAYIVDTMIVKAIVTIRRPYKISDI